MIFCQLKLTSIRANTWLCQINFYNTWTHRLITGHLEQWFFMFLSFIQKKSLPFSFIGSHPLLGSVLPTSLRAAFVHADCQSTNNTVKLPSISSTFCARVFHTNVSFWHLFSSYLYVENNVGTTNLYVKCWWNCQPFLRFWDLYVYKVPINVGEIEPNSLHVIMSIVRGNIHK